MILFSAVEYQQCTEAYFWHKGFTGADDALFPRSRDDFQSLVLDGCVWAARHPGNGDYLALAYANYDKDDKVCEIGGLMVSLQARGKGLGAMMMRLALAHILVEEDLLSDPDVRIVAHVLQSNDAPRGIIERELGFKKAGVVERPASELPGLRADDDGVIRGDEYEISLPKTLQILAEWANGWTGLLNDDGAAVVEFRAGMNMSNWGAILDDMAARYIEQTVIGESDEG